MRDEINGLYYSSYDSLAGDVREGFLIWVNRQLLSFDIILVGCCGLVGLYT